MDKDEKPKDYINPLDLIKMILWGPIEAAEEEVETMTTTEVMEHLKVRRAQLTKWANSGELKPISRGKYDSTAVRSFVPPSYR